MQLAPQQAEAVQKIKDWLGGGHMAGKQLFRLFGYAGTGKTTTIATAVSDMRLRVAYIAYTGKAAAVMRNNGLPAQTLHNLIYVFDAEDKQTKELYFSLNPDSPAKTVDLIVLDECSMVGEAVARDLLSFGTPVLAIGDPAQLPPVKGAGYFTNAKPDAMLTEVHRQALDSPVLNLATKTRAGEPLPRGKYGSSEVTLGSDIDEDRLWTADQVLVGTNATRKRLNRRARAYFNMQGQWPQFGEKLVCLRNNHTLGVMNGEMFNVLECVEQDQRWLRLKLYNAEDGRNVSDLPVHKSFFDAQIPMSEFDEMRSTQFDFGYALTVHKSQGSQWNDVIVIDESAVFRDDCWKWLYTGITRAAERVTIVRGKV
jgi:exodeoxyribonuclease-5